MLQASGGLQSYRHQSRMQTFMEVCRMHNYEEIADLYEGFTDLCKSLQRCKPLSRSAEVKISAEVLDIQSFRRPLQRFAKVQIC